MRRLIAPVAFTLFFASAALAQVSRPNPLPTPQVDANAVVGVPRPSASPNCQDGSVSTNGFLGDNCLYACASYTRKILAGTGCVLPTSQATVTTTPTPTVTTTPTLTATKTATPTPTVTATP